ncbi:hypothetical protein FB451DRAFT_1272715 [Mycena latifolia]|nr:hypothetical protein FB451DRAFT_1272715 [Mycena latifolia]
MRITFQLRSDSGYARVPSIIRALLYTSQNQSSQNSGSRRKMSAQHRIPVEVWFKISDYIPKDAVPALSSTSHLFRSMLRPLLFATFYFDTSTAKVDRCLERLDFFSSNEIAPLVRSCDIAHEECVSLDRETLLAKFCKRLPRLIRLRRFYASGWDLTQVVMNILCRLPALEELEVFSYDHIPSLLHIENSSVGLIDEGETLERKQAVFPLLREFKCWGPCDALPAVLSLPTLTHLTVDNCDPRSLITDIRTPNKITSLSISFTSWHHLTESEMYNSFVNTLYALFPQLTELRIAFMHNAYCNSAATMFFNALPDAPALPPTLTHLCFSWEFDREFGFTSTDILPDFAALREVLVTRCPALVALWLDGQEFLFRWRKYPDGTAVEAFIDNYKDVVGLGGEEWATFWEHSNYSRG